MAKIAETSLVVSRRDADTAKQIQRDTRQRGISGIDKGGWTGIAIGRMALKLEVDPTSHTSAHNVTAAAAPFQA
jgi:hypothetical protein